MNSPTHWMMFSTFQEQDYFAYPTAESYDCIVLNANMAAHAPSALAAFLANKTQSQNYIIDPQTHAFQHDPVFISAANGQPKTSIRKLVSALGGKLEEVAGSRQLEHTDLASDQDCELLVRNSLSFQNQRLAEQMEKLDVDKYFDESEKTLYKPNWLIAPYFYLSEIDFEQWLSLNLRLISIASKVAESPQSKLLAEIVLSKGVLSDSAKIESLCDGLSRCQIAGCLLWIDDFDEGEARLSDLIAFRYLVECLRAKGKMKQVINLHGGYFSVLLGALGNGLTGVVHGPEFGESRSVVPVGGGIPISRYYVPALKRRLKYRDAVQIFQRAGWLDSAKDFHKNVCSCSECVSTLDGDIAAFTKFSESTPKSMRRKHGIVRIDFPTSEARQRCLRHYLWCKHYEFTEPPEISKRLEALRLSIEKMQPFAGSAGVEHLRKWEEALK